MTGERTAEPMSELGPFSDLGTPSCEVRFTPMSRLRQLDRLRPKSANSDHRVLGEGFNSAPTFIALTYRWMSRPQHQKRTF
jgi:hypothetical protein